MVSVVVPAWNAEATLRETLESVAAQTYDKFEIIIVDDGSTDATAKIAEEFCASEPRARLIAQKNGGVAAARNRAIADAKGTWIAPIDADDLWHPTKIEKQIAAALSAPARPGFIYCWHRLIDEDSRVIGSGPRRVLNGRAFNQLAYLNVVENGSALLLSRDTLKEVGGYDPSLRERGAEGCEDVLLQLQVARRHPVACVPEYLVGHRRHGRNMSSGFDRMVRSWRLVYDKAGAEKPRLPRQLLRWVEGKCAFDIAEQEIHAGKYLGGLGHLAEALVRDPVRCGSLLAYRAVRSARRRLAEGPSAAEPPRFSDVDPAEPLGTDPHELVALSRSLDALNSRRLRRLAALDRAQSSIG
jgi:glycosyltransferase involved in cell wall biosynthesis